MADTDQLFRDRVPEAAAIQIALVLAECMEAHLATLEQLEVRKSTPARDIKRQRGIIANLMRHCIDLSVPPTGFLFETKQRFKAEIEAHNVHQELPHA